jgi:DNA-binding PadR family transcriptional regulator
MEESGLIEEVDGAAEGREDRHVFAITESGVAEFDRWFEGGADTPRLARRPLLVKITLAGPERLRQSLEHIEEYERACAQRLSELAKWREDVPVGGSQIRADHVLLRLGLSADTFQLEGELRWARHAHEMVSWLLDREAIWPSAPERSDAGGGVRESGAARKAFFGRIAAKHRPGVAGERDTGPRKGGER